MQTNKLEGKILFTRFFYSKNISSSKQTEKGGKNCIKILAIYTNRRGEQKKVKLIKLAELFF